MRLGADEDLHRIGELLHQGSEARGSTEDVVDALLDSDDRAGHRPRVDPCPAVPLLGMRRIPLLDGSPYGRACTASSTSPPAMRSHPGSTSSPSMTTNGAAAKGSGNTGFRPLPEPRTLGGDHHGRTDARPKFWTDRDRATSGNSLRVATVTDASSRPTSRVVSASARPSEARRVPGTDPGRPRAAARST